MLDQVSNYFKAIFILIIWNSSIYADNFNYNIYNNHGVVGLINTPTARFYDEGVHGVTLYDGTPDQKITLSSNPYDWLEASFFYTNVQGFPYPNYEYQDYKDKGFNIKIRLKKQGTFPAIAVGLYDFAGTGFYSSEYIVSSYGIDNFDFHFGLGFGQLDGTKDNIKNPFGYIHNSFKDRPIDYEGLGGTFNPSKYFSGKTATPFYGISYLLTNNILFKVEKDTTLVDGPGIRSDTDTRLRYKNRKSDYSFGIDYLINDNFSLGASYERGGFFSLKLIYKNDPIRSIKKYEYQKASISSEDDKYTRLIKNLEENGIGVNRITETANSIGLELTQYIHPDLDLIEEIILTSSREAGINKNIKKDIKIADLDAVSEIDKAFQRSSQLIYERNEVGGINTNTGLRFKPFLASREEFFKGAILLENDTEFVLRENLFFNTNLKYSLANNFEDLRFPPIDVFPAQVRSDVKQYLKNMDQGILIGRAQLDYHLTAKKNHHLMLTAGILEDMFSGYGIEYLFFKNKTNYSIGFEAFHVFKRDYEWGLGLKDYQNTTYTANLYYRNYGTIPFDMKLSAGEYLAGDVGATIEFSRTFNSGLKFGVFATFTNVSTEEYGEGGFDKGLFFKIPIYGNLIDYTWRPLTKDPGAKLIRKNSLHDLLVRFRPIN